MIYVVTNKLTGAEVYRYESDAPVEWAGMEFSTHAHAEFIADGGVSQEFTNLGPISKLAYMERFTDAELAAVYGAAKVSLAVEVWLEKFKLSEFIDLADPRTLAGLQALESNGLIGAGRALEVLHG